MESLLALADELERRDARVAQSLAAVERLQAEVEEVRTHAAAAAEFLAVLPSALAQHARDERQAEEDRVRAEAALRDAETQAREAKREHDRLVAARAVQTARDALADADRRAARAREHQAALEREGAERRDEAASLSERAATLQARVPESERTSPGLEGVLAWASQARGALIVARSGLARERDAVVREASELLGSVLGDPQAATSVAGLRGRLERGL